MGLVDTSKTERLEHPEESGQWVEIRPLLATELDEARDVRMRKLLDLWGDILKDAATPTDRGDTNELESRVQQYDSEFLLKYAVTGWSYDASVNPENIARLDGVTRDWLVREVVKRNTRPLLK